jgi:hypothetical protein
VKALRTSLTALALSLNVAVCLAQQSATSGNIRVSFPTPNWTETEPPAQLRAAYDGTKSPVKLVFHAVSVQSQLRLYITQTDYPDTSKEKFLAGYLAGIRNALARQAAGDVTEYLDQNGTIPTQIFKVDLPGNNFIEDRAIICEGRVFLAQVGGPTSSSSEGKQCLNGISIAGERPLPTSMLNALSQTRAKTAAYERGRRIGYAAGKAAGRAFIVTLIVGVIVVFVLAVRRKPVNRSATPASAHVAPPPLPPTVTPDKK